MTDMPYMLAYQYARIIGDNPQLYQLHVPLFLLGAIRLTAAYVICPQVKDGCFDNIRLQREMMPFNYCHRIKDERRKRNVRTYSGRLPGIPAVVFLLITASFWVYVGGMSAYMQLCRITVDSGGMTMNFDSLNSTALFLLLPAVFLLGAAVTALLSVLRRRWGFAVASLALCKGAAIVYLLLPPQSYSIQLYMTYRYFFGINLLPIIAKYPFLGYWPQAFFVLGVILLTVSLLLDIRGENGRRFHPQPES